MSDLPPSSPAAPSDNEELIASYKAEIAELDQEVKALEALYASQKATFEKDGINWMEDFVLDQLRNMEIEALNKISEVRDKLNFRMHAVSRGGIPGPGYKAGPDDIPVVGTVESDTEFANEFRKSLQDWAQDMKLSVQKVRNAVQKEESSSSLKGLAGIVKAAITVLSKASAYGQAIEIVLKMEKLIGHAKKASAVLGAAGAAHYAATKNASMSAKTMDGLFLEMQKTIEEVVTDWDKGYQNFVRRWKTENSVPIGGYVPRSEFKRACQRFSDNLAKPKDLEKALLLEALELLRDDEIALIGDFDGDGDLAGYIHVELSAYENAHDGKYQISLEDKGIDGAGDTLNAHFQDIFRDMAGKSIIHMPMKIRLSVYATHQGFLGTYFKGYEAWRYRAGAGSADFVAAIDRKEDPKNAALHNEIMSRGIVEAIKVGDLA